MTQNVDVRQDGEGNTIIEADEVFFEIPPDQPIPSVEEVESEFDLYWNNGVNWPVPDPPPPTIEELKEQVDGQNEQINMLTDCLLEMSEIVYA